MTKIVDQCNRALARIVGLFPEQELVLVGHSAGAHLVVSPLACFVKYGDDCAFGGACGDVRCGSPIFHFSLSRFLC